ncbi:hypothetical protein BZG36_05214, partial [Bifiguratus adelaidae]
MDTQELKWVLNDVLQKAIGRHDSVAHLSTLPGLISHDQASFPQAEVLPETGLGVTATYDLICKQVLPRLNNAAGPRWFGLVTGGVTPAALVADWLVPVWDQNVVLHRPLESVSTTLEQHSLDLLLDLFGLPREQFPGKTLTTGATASNILAILSARQYLGLTHWHLDIAEEGYCGKQIMCLGIKSHASIVKAASVAGVGRKNCIECGQWRPEEGLVWDIEKVESLLQSFQADGDKAAIVVVGFGEVNTGSFSQQIDQLRALCDKYKAWLHIDAADGHKWLNVPYDCGIFFTKHTRYTVETLGGIKAAYLEDDNSESNIPDPITMNLENSRRFRALPVYSTLMAYGKAGYQDIVERNCDFAQALHAWMNNEGSAWYETLSPCPLNIVLFHGRGKLASAKGCDDVLTFRLPGDDQDTQAVLRVSRPSVPRLKTINEVASMEWVRQHVPLIPVPKVLFWNASSEHAFEYTCLEWVPGVCMNDIWEQLDKEGIDDKIVSAIADVHLALVHAQPSFHQLGGLCFAADGSIVPGPVMEITMYDLDNLTQHFASCPQETLESLNIGGPFSSEAEYDIARLRRDMHIISIHSSCAHLLPLLPRLTRLIERLADPEDPLQTALHQKMHLSHRDLHMSNLMWDPDRQCITGVLDWEFSGVVSASRWDPGNTLIVMASAGESNEQASAFVHRLQMRLDALIWERDPEAYAAWRVQGLKTTVDKVISLVFYIVKFTITGEKPDAVRGAWSD